MPRRPTIIDVANLARVSKTTVARVVNGEEALVQEKTRQRVLEAIAHLGYERNAIARSLRTERTFTIALSIPDITNPFWPEVARGVQDTVEPSGYSVVLLNSDWDPSRQRNHLRVVRRNLFDGLILNSVGISESELEQLGIPVITLSGSGNDTGFDSVGSDSEAAVHLALEHLTALGHRRIGLIAGVSKRRLSRSRYAFFKAFFRERQLPFDESLVVRCAFSQEAGAEATKKLLRLDRPPTAICAGNDILAVGALMATRQAAVEVPTDISIVGMDDIYAATATYPPLTTVEKPKYEIGVEAARLLLARIEGEVTEQRHVRLPCRLILRESTAPPGQG